MFFLLSFERDNALLATELMLILNFHCYLFCFFGSTIDKIHFNILLALEYDKLVFIAVVGNDFYLVYIETVDLMINY